MHKEALHKGTEREQAGLEARASWSLRVVIEGDLSAQGNAGVIVYQRKDRIGDITADIIKVNINAIRTSFLQCLPLLVCHLR